MNLTQNSTPFVGMGSMYGRSCAITFACLFALSSMLPAQSVQAEGANVIEEVVVTARKKEESMQEIPVVVNVLTSDAINSQRIEGIKDIGTIVPGLMTARTYSSGNGVIYMRGIGTGAINALFDQAVAINIDGVGINSAQLLNAGMIDLDRIEVLKGPQALFYGKNSPGGVIALHTKDPTDEFELELSGMYETESSEKSLRAIISGPFNETLSGRLALNWSKSDKALRDIHSLDRFETGPTGDQIQTAFAPGSQPIEIKTFYAMATLLWEPTDNFSANLKYSHMYDDQKGHPMYNFQRVQCPNGPQVVYPVPGIDNCKKSNDAIFAGMSSLLVSALPDFSDHTGNGFNYNEDNFAVLNMTYEMDNDLILTSVTGYWKNSLDRLVESSFQAAAGLPNTPVATHEQWSQELRLVSVYDGPVNFTLGAFYANKEIDYRNAVEAGSNLLGIPVSSSGVFPFSLGRQSNSQEGTAYSVFAQVDWAFAERWTLSAGGRYSYEEKEGESIVGAGGGPDIEVTLLEPKPDWSNFSPEVTLSYQYSDDVMFFAGYRNGFKSGGFDAAFKARALVASAGTPFENVFDEEEVTGFEVGMKSTLLDGTMRLNVTAYSFEYENMQLSVLSSSSDGNLVVQVINAAESTVEGLELETLWMTPVDGLTLTANFAWLDASYDEFIADCFTGQTIAMGCSVNPHPVTGNFTGADMSGRALPFASDLSATLSLDYTIPLGNSWSLAFNVTSSYKDEYNPTPLLLPDSYETDAFWITNVALSLFSADDKWEIYARGVNVGDELYGSSGSNAPFSGSSRLTGTNDPSGLGDFYQFIEGGRQISLGVTYRM